MLCAMRRLKAKLGEGAYYRFVTGLKAFDKEKLQRKPLVRGFLLKFSGVVFAPLEVAVEDNHRGDGVDYFLALFSAGVRLVEVSGG